MKCIISLSFLIFLLISCNHDHTDTYYSSDFTNKYNLVPIDTLLVVFNDDVIIGRSRLFHTWNNNILISDREFYTLWILDNELNYIDNIGKSGEGPGEFTDSPIPLVNGDSLWLIDYKTQRAYLYDGNRQLLDSALLPPDLYYTSSPPVTIGNHYIVSAGGPFPQSDPQYYRKYNSLFVLDNTFNTTDNILEWDDIYLESDYEAFAYSNFITDVAKGSGSTFYAQQRATYIIHHINNEFDIIKSFGRQPEYYQPPKRGISFRETQQSLENFYEFVSGTTHFYGIDYDSTSNLLFSRYSNLTHEGLVNRNPYLHDTFLQIYDDNYNCIFDGPIDGRFALAENGKIYILNKETPEYLKFIVFKVTNRKSQR